MGQTRIPRSGDFYRHFKNKLYQIISVAEDSETGEPFVVYQAMYGEFKTYIRPLTMFLSEVDSDKYPEVKDVYRFTHVGNNRYESLKESQAVVDNTTKAVVDNTTKAVVSSSEKSTKEAEVQSETKIEAEETINPFLLEFLDADTFADKLEILKSGKESITDRLINDLAVVLDVVIEEGEIEQRYDALRNSLETFKRYECNRFNRS